MPDPGSAWIEEEIEEKEVMSPARLRLCRAGPCVAMRRAVRMPWTSVARARPYRSGGACAACFLYDEQEPVEEGNLTQLFSEK